MVEQVTVNHQVIGSSPVRRAKGRVAEWLIAPVLKTGLPERVT